MNEAVCLKRATAEKMLGSTWCVNHDNKSIFQHLGYGRPPFSFNKTFSTSEEAVQAVGKDYAVATLPESIRLPRFTPLAVDRELQNAATSIAVLRFDDLLGEGLRVVTLRITGVDYEAAPKHLSGDFDFVATQVYLGSDCKVRITHDKAGLPDITAAVQRQGAHGWQDDDQCRAFIFHAEAFEQADVMAKNLISAADWRKN